MNFEVKWNEFVNKIFTHGSEIKYINNGRGVYFQNLYFSSGSIIVQWSSAPYYPVTRTGLQLPLLKRGNAYNLNVALDETPKGSLLIRVSYYDRSEELIGAEIISLNGGEFIYPHNAFSYTIELINTGVSSLFFDKLTISESRLKKETLHKV